MAAAATLDTPVDRGRGFAFPNLIRRGTLVLNAYSTGGVAVTKTTFSLPTSLDDLRVDESGGYVANWDKTNGKVLVYWQTDSDNGVAMGEITDATDLAAVAFRFRAEGR